MSHNAYPVSNDVKTFLNSIAGITVPSGYTCDNAIASAVAEVERITEYSPFLSTGASSTRYFDPPGPKTSRPWKGGSRKLILGCGLLTLTSLAVGADNPSTQQVLTVDSDFYLAPRDASYNVPVRPYTSIDFFQVQWGLPKSIAITGTWGFSAILPDDLWQAVIYLAASYVVTDFLQGILNSPSSVKDDDVTITQDFDTSLGTAWAKKGRDIIQAYTLIC